jgi:hypothetical protein
MHASLFFTFYSIILAVAASNVWKFVAVSLPVHWVGEVLAVWCLCHSCSTSGGGASLDRSTLTRWVLIWAWVIYSILNILLCGHCNHRVGWLDWSSCVHTVHEIAHIRVVSVSNDCAVVHGNGGGRYCDLIIDAWMIGSTRLLGCCWSCHPCVAICGVVLVHVLVRIWVSSWYVVLFSWLWAYASESA